MSVQKAKFSDNRNERLKSSLVYLDYTNARLKILEFDSLSKDTIDEIFEYAKKENLGKVLINCKKEDLNIFKDAGFIVEGVIDGFFRGEDAHCASFFIDSERSKPKRKEEEDKILEMCMDKSKIAEPNELKDGYQVRDCVEEDIPQMIEIFKEVFKTYPTPVFDKDYLKKVMNDNILFKAVLENGKIISIASADMDKKNLNAEITDCATYPEYRGQGLLTNLIYGLEDDLKEKGYYTLYSLSRAINTGINMSLRKHGYDYKGRLVNNCDICGGFEDMNIWVKKLKD
ncbi:putative beta-lysine N-acetyltransferase [Herbivorax sp. ANBcel31]|uniref:putative beta-lysine N-acetyltransferase n=1 Tax=Herbivorax sp. ANBcel31 TaxID=3069754 RepID=UPI0027B7903C|nr:putative beta-lysine N-acetyltransferase [Herbivorax sp. ANBcel31]MDQ2087342.1 putative beta-lysine N-acetyltransferase [Herbivorax sp. ANBcel31]